jgi:hypothetical protein
MPTNGGRDGDGGATNAEKQRVYELLGFTQVNSSANPSPVRPFGTTTLSWEAKFPTNLHSEVTIVVAGNEVHGISPGTLSGSATVTLDQTTIFGITAKTPIVERTIAVLTVPVNESECQPSSFLVLALTNRIKQGIDGALQGRLHDPGGSKVTADVGVVFIVVTINLQGQDTMDISMQLVIQMDEAARNVAVTARSIVADAHIGGLGSLCEGAVSQTAQAFMTEIANNQIVPTVVQGLNDQIQQAATAAKTADPQHRDFVLTSFTLDSTEVAFVICPTGTGGPSSRLDDISLSQLHRPPKVR